MPIHSCPLPGGGTGYKWGDRGKCFSSRAQAEHQAEAAYANGYAGDNDLALDEALAYDYARTRTFDKDGRMHVEIANISKANVCPYYGREIPNPDGKLRLEPDKIYYLLRDPEELAKAAPTFNKIQLLYKHIGVNADNPQQEHIVGTTGESAEFDGTYLKNSLAVWDADAIEGIESGEQQQLSCSYHYVADMTPGDYHGQPYDGVMRNIVGNHVALVPVGRAGADVLVGDSLPLELIPMNTARRIIVAQRAALSAFVRPALANDSAPIPLRELVGNGKTPEQIAKDVKKKYASKFDVDTRKLSSVLKLAADEAEEEEDDDAGEDEDETEEEKAERERKEKAAADKRAKDKAAKDKAAKDKRAKDVGPGGPEKRGEDETEEERMEREKKEKAEDEAREKEAKDKEAKDRKAHDAAIVAQAKREVREEAKALREAQDDVRDVTGELACDSAEDFYKAALDELGVAYDGVEGKGLQSLFRAVNAKRFIATPKLASDADSRSAFATLFPNAMTVSRG